MSDEKRVLQRSEVPERYKWNIQAMYGDEAEWEADLTKVRELSDRYQRHEGHLGDSAESLLLAFQEKDQIWRTLEHAYVYARMKKDEDNRDGKYQAMSAKTQSLMAETAAKLSFFTPELLSLPEDRILSLLAHPQLSVYEFVIRDLLREKEHVLSRPEEQLLAQFGEVSGATNSIFGMINNADIKFGSLVDEDGDEIELTHGRYIGLMESQDRTVRERAFRSMYAAYEKQKNTLATNYFYNTKVDVMYARIRKYPSALHAALSGDNIPVEVYTNLVDVVNSRLSLLHRYVKVRKKLLGVDQVHMYDMYAPLVQLPKRKVEFEESVKMMKEGLAPLGETYVGDLTRGIDAGWIDVFENEGKTSGAYSFGSFDSMPYILLNHSNKLKDVFTLVHEMGHSMHSYYTRGTQPFVYGGHSIFTAEVASTVNECLLMDHLIRNSKDELEKKYLLNLYIEEFRTTLFRQTMFAEFEQMTHAAVEAGEALTPDWLKQEYLALNRKYFGDEVFYDDEIAMEWSRIPHFYNAFYVYKYATGYSAAVALSKRILTEGKPAVEAYLAFLRSGESDYPIRLLQQAGVDMSRPDPVMAAMDAFEQLIEEIEAMV